MSGYEQRLAFLRRSLSEISPAEAQRGVTQENLLLLDIRDTEEIQLGMPQHAVHVPRSMLEMRIQDVCADLTRPIAVLCAGGIRSLFTTESLRNLGYQHVVSVRGGYKAWKEQSLPSRIPVLLNAHDKERYSRHLLIPEVGEAGQVKLRQSRVLLLGAGGLGSPAALYLAAAGIGTLGIVDADVVELSNLQRQIIHTETGLGQAKVASAAEAIQRLNSTTKVMQYPIFLDESNALEILNGYDLVIDGSDNFRTRYLVNDACIKLGLPNVHGAVYRFDGYVTTFCGADDAPCYRCFHPEPPPPEMAPSCMEAGVLGVVPGIIGLLQANEAIKVLLGIGENLVGRVLRFDALHNEFGVFEIAKEADCLCTHDAAQITLQPIEPAVCSV